MAEPGGPSPLNAWYATNAEVLSGQMFGNASISVFAGTTEICKLQFSGGDISIPATFTYIDGEDAPVTDQVHIVSDVDIDFCGCVVLRLYTSYGVTDLKLDNFYSGNNYYPDTDGNFYSDANLLLEFANGGQLNCPPITITIADNVAITDLVSFLAFDPIKRFDIADVVNVLDTLNILFPEDLISNLVSQVLVGDEVSLVFYEDKIIEIADAVGISESAVVEILLSLLNTSVADVSTVSDTVTVDVSASNTFRAFAETVTVADVVQALVLESQRERYVEDTANVSDVVNILVLSSGIRYLADTAQAVDQLSVDVLAGRERQVQDDVSVSDKPSVFVLESNIRYREDAVSVSDDVTVSIGGTSHLRIESAVQVNDTLFNTLGNIIYNITEGISVSDTVVTSVYAVSRIPNPPRDITPDELQGMVINLEKIETKVDFNPENVFELIYVNLKQLWTDLKEYFFGAPINFPADRRTDMTHGTETDLYAFVGENASDFYEPLRDSEIHQFTMLNGKQGDGDIPFVLSATKPKGISTPSDTATANDSVTIEILPS